MIGTMSNDALTAHAIPTQVISVMFIILLGIGDALAIQVGTILPTSAIKAKRLCIY